MRYYIWVNEQNKVVGYMQTEKQFPTPAVEVSEEKYRELGLYRESPETQAPSTVESDVWDEMATAYKEGVQEA